jgi:hypothetical protein
MNVGLLSPNMTDEYFPPPPPHFPFGLGRIPERDLNARDGGLELNMREEYVPPRFPFGQGRIPERGLNPQARTFRPRSL